MSQSFFSSWIPNVNVNTSIHVKYVFQEYPVDNYILATNFKAVVGALLESSGEERAAHFVRDFVITQLNGK